MTYIIQFAGQQFKIQSQQYQFIKLILILKSIYSMTSYSQPKIYNQVYFTNYQQSFQNISDRRNPKTKQYHQTVIYNLHKANIQTLKIKLTDKQKIQYSIKQPTKIQLPRGWYCFITDNKINTQHTILTIHGSPGNHIEWAGLETQTNKKIKCRWINFIMPGYDGYDERRGDYSGNPQHFSQMIISLLKQMNIKKVILCGHSMGSIFSTYLITKHQQYFYGYINITGIVDQWYCGMMVFYQTTIARFGFNHPQFKQYYQHLLNNNQFRAKLHQEFLKNTQQTFFGEIRFPKLTQYQLCSYIKLFNNVNNGFSQLYRWNKNINIPRVLIFGKTDPIHQLPKINDSIFNLCFGQNSYLKNPQYAALLKQMKYQLEDTFRKKLGIQIQGQKIQQYLCYCFQETGHNAHKRRPNEIAKILQVYLTFLSIKLKYQSLNNTKL